MAALSPGLFGLRESEIFECLQALRGQKFTIIGGYAVNAYALPRFSIDCDIVCETKTGEMRITAMLEKRGFKKTAASENAAYHGNFARLEKTLEHGFKASFDILTGSVFDRQSGATFSAQWVFEHSEEKTLRGKTVAKSVKARTISCDGLLAMKIACGRTSDLRDVFMLAPLADNAAEIRREIESRTPLAPAAKKALALFESRQFKNNLEGVFGFVDEKTFQKNQTAARKLLETKKS